MAQYIDRDALVAEIDKEIKCIYAGREYVGIPLDEENRVYRLQIAKGIINTLEVKGVDLDYIKDELDRVVKIYKPDGDFGWGTLYNIATHFFELGLKAQKGK